MAVSEYESLRPLFKKTVVSEKLHHHMAFTVNFYRHKNLRNNMWTDSGRKVCVEVVENGF
jgi:hypothetical protein